MQKAEENHDILAKTHRSRNLNLLNMFSAGVAAISKLTFKFAGLLFHVQD